MPIFDQNNELVPMQISIIPNREENPPTNSKNVTDKSDKRTKYLGNFEVRVLIVKSKLDFQFNNLSNELWINTIAKNSNIIISGSNVNESNFVSIWVW